MKARFPIYFYSLLFTFFLSQDALSITVDEAIVLAKEKNLATSSAWRALGHYRYSTLTTSWASQADNPEFFISPEGKQDASAELIATIKVFYSNQSANTDPNGIGCRFPARQLWLSQNIAASTEWQCPEQKVWLADMQTEKLSIVFASSYLDSPSSMFGHTYLRFYNSTNDSFLLSPTVNYAADSQKRKGVIDFAIRGLFGGFPGVADKLPQYRRVRTYTENEGRSLWEYPLALDADQIELIALHLFEIKDGQFDYFFLDENCSYRTLAALSVAIPDKVNMAEFDGFAIPIDTIKALQTANVVAEPGYWPAADAKLSAQLTELSTGEKALVIALLKSTDANAVEQLEVLPADRQLHVLHAALTYTSIIISREKLPDENLENRIAFIKERLLQQIDLSKKISPESPLAPTDSHPSSRFGITYGRDNHDSFTLLGYRAAYHSLEDPLQGFDAGAEVNVLEINLKVDAKNTLSLDSATLIDVTSRARSDDFFQPAAWNFHIRADQKYFSRTKSLTPNIGYSRGKTVSFAGIDFSFFAGANLNINGHLTNSAVVEPLARVDAYRQLNSINYGGYFQRSTYLGYSDQRITERGILLSMPISRYGSIVFRGRHDTTKYQSNRIFSAGIFYYF